MDQFDSAPQRGMGDNSAPFEVDLNDLETLLNPAVLRDQMELDYAAHIARRDELLAGVERFFEAVKQINDDEMQGKAGDFVAQLQAHWKAVEADRATWVRPFLDAQATGQKFFKAENLDPVKRAADDIDAKMNVYANERRARVRRELEAQQRAAAAEAEAKRAAAEASMRPSQLEEASKAAAQAEKLERKAKKATVAELTRVRGDLGSVATQTVKWVCELVDLDAVPREYMMLNAAKADAAVAAGLRDAPDGTPAIPGLRIVEQTTVRVRS